MPRELESIKTYFQKILTDYDGIRGKDVREVETPYWDVVVITTADPDQTAVYEAQLKQKYERHELPLGLPIHVINDPPGPKIGNGGSTLIALKFLQEKYENDSQGLLQKRVLLIHAGGQSQRMPSASILGKIFSPVPKGNPIYQMLDMKLAMFIPLIPHMCPGVFVTCADDFLLYRLPKDMKGLKFATSGFTALAHPSTLAIGVGHGVYVVDDLDSVDPSSPVLMRGCKQVLQKPSESLMYEKGAVMRAKDLTFCDGIEVSGRAVYTDSSFFFAHGTTEKLLKFLDSHGPVTCEIDAYGDFLQALGPGASDSYISNTSNVSNLTEDLHATRKAVFKTLQGSDITLLLMNCSKFIHIGTMKEYITYFCHDNGFQSELGLTKDAFNHWINDIHQQNNKSYILADGPRVKRPRVSEKESDTARGCIMHSVLPLSSNVPETSVVEFCNFGIPVNIGQNCIVSNCEFDINDKTLNGEGDVKMQTHIDIPSDVFIHTIPVFDDGQTKFATVVFDVRDNLKRESHNKDLMKLPFLGKYVEDYTATVKIDLSSVQSEQGRPESKVNLWFSSLFPLVDSMSQSLQLALQSVEALKKDNMQSVSFSGFKMVSMANILKQKDVFAMLKQRDKVYKTIKSNQSNVYT